MGLFKNKWTKNSSGALWILIVAAVLLEGTACIQYFYSYTGLKREAERRAVTELRRAELEIETHTIEMETAAKLLSNLAEQNLNNPKGMFEATRLVAKSIDHTTSLAISMVPGYFPQYGTYFEVCSSRISEDSVFTRQIGSEEHDYTKMEWFQNGLKIDSCFWSDPYLDDSGSQAYVVSCSCPIHDAKGKVVGVVCIDLSLDYLHTLSDYLQIYHGGYYTIHSGEGTEILGAPDTIPGAQYVHFNEFVDATGWTMSIVIPKDEIFKDLRRIGLIVTIIMILGLVLLVLIIYHSGKSLVKLVNLMNQKERIESELNIAREIQMAMLPTRFPPFEDYPDLSAYGLVLPAKEVGGDLFDFHIRDNKLYFCVGDVSGKGVPAALVMAMSRSLFRSLSSYLDSPGIIMTQMNNALSGERNDQNMFLTLFLGILDLATGELRYCNAGHNAPVRLQKDGTRAENITVQANLPLGVLADFTYNEQRTQLAEGQSIFLYTDGLTEAENIHHELFGDERMMAQLESSADLAPRDIVARMQDEVHRFVGEAAQSDDLTLFAIQYIKRSSGAVQTEIEHHSLVMRNDIQQIPTLAEWLDSLGLPADMVMPMNLALEEAVSNVMLYAYPNTNSGRVLVECEKDNSGVLSFTISDTGIPFDPTKQEDPDITKTAEERPIGGLGIFLVRQIMDEIGYERKGGKNILKLLKKIKK